MTAAVLPPTAARPAGYHLLAADGGIFAFGAASPVENPAPKHPGCTWVALGGRSDGSGALALASDGTVAYLGERPDESLGAAAGGAPAIDIEVVARGQGFWILDIAGGVFSFGDAGYFGSIPGLGEGVSTAPIVGMASTPTALGYWILDAAGGVYAFGDAGFHGSVPALRLDEAPAPAVDIAASPTGEGYAVLERDGTIRGFGDAAFPGALRVGYGVTARAFAAVGAPGSYVVVDGRGFVHPLGVAPMFGSAAGLQLQAPVVDISVVMAIDPSAP